MTVRNTCTFIPSDELVMVASNEGALYNRFLELAKTRATTDTWMEHIVCVVLPHLQGATGGYRGERLVCPDLQVAAELLHDLYTAEMADGALVHAG